MTVYAHRKLHALRHPQFADFVIPKAGEPYADDDPLVLAHPWAFGTIDEVDAAAAAETSLTDGTGAVEIAVADPGLKRRRVRTRG